MSQCPFLIGCAGGLCAVIGASCEGAGDPGVGASVWWPGYPGDTGVRDVMWPEPQPTGAAAAAWHWQAPPPHEKCMSIMQATPTSDFLKCCFLYTPCQCISLSLSIYISLLLFRSLSPSLYSMQYTLLAWSFKGKRCCQSIERGNVANIENIESYVSSSLPPSLYNSFSLFSVEICVSVSLSIFLSSCFSLSHTSIFRSHRNNRMI